MKRRTYLDANILIAAFQGEEPLSRRALEVLDDPDRQLVVSDFVRLEVLPKPTLHQRREEIEFMEAVLSKAENVPCTAEVTKSALAIASRYDVAPMDALHVGAAVVAGVDEVVTLEKPNKPMCRVAEARVVSIYPEKVEGV